MCPKPPPETSTISVFSTHFTGNCVGKRKWGERNSFLQNPSCLAFLLENGNQLSNFKNIPVREEENILETCVARVDDVINDLFVIKHFKVEGLKMLVHHSIFFPNVDGRLACAATVGVTQKIPLRWFYYRQRRKSLFVNPSSNWTSHLICVLNIPQWLSAWPS